MMGLWFTASALGNFMASLVGGQVSANEIQHLSELFLRCVIALILGAVILWLLRKPIHKLLNQSKTADSTQPM